MDKEAVLVGAVPGATPAPVECGLLEQVTHQRWTRLNPSVVILPVQQIDARAIHLLRHAVPVAGPSLFLLEGIHVDVFLDQIVELWHIFEPAILQRRS